MRKLLAIVLSVAMVASLATCFTVNVSAEVLPLGTAVEVGRADSAPNVTDGELDSVYAKVFDMYGHEVLVEQVIDDDTGETALRPDDHAPVGYNSNVYRYDAAENPDEEDSDWYNTRAEGYAAWDDSYLYFCLVLTGAGELNDNAGAQWQGDAIQFSVYTTQPGTTEYIFSQVGGQIQTALPVDAGLSMIQSIMYAYNNSDRIPEGIITQKDEDTIVYEFAFSWQALGFASVSENQEIPFNVTINLNDADMVEQAFCGFQIGQGTFNESSPTHAGVQNSVKFKLVDEVTVHTHEDADGQWESDGTNHWHTCSCGETFDLAAHSGGEATCSGGAVCEVCGVEYGEANPDNHVDADGEWESDGTNHWHTCANCGIEFDKAAHSGGEANCHAKAVCEVCGVEYGEFDANNHDGETEIRDAVAASCDTDGYTGDTYCLGCGEKIADGEVIPATGEHVDADGLWESDGTNHWHTCACGTIFDLAAHSGGEANCHSGAICEVCEAEYGDFDSDNHDGGTEIRNDVAATCNTPGYTGDTYCLGCGEKIADGTEIPATGIHVDDNDAWESDGENHWHTCVNCGTEFDKAAHSGGEANCHSGAICEVCGAEYGEFDSNNHDGETEVRGAVAATCVDEGYTGDTYCLGCDEKIADGTVIPATGVHVDAENEWLSDETDHWLVCDVCGTEFDRAEHSGGEATCSSGAICEICGAEYGEVDPNNHVDADGLWENDETNHWHTCSCGEIFDLAAHSGGEANCHSGAICEVCGVEYGEVDPDNHEGGTEIRNAVDATADTDGYTGDTYCLGCGEKIADGTVIPATGGDDPNDNVDDNVNGGSGDNSQDKPDDTSDLDMTVWFALAIVSAGFAVLTVAAKKKFEK